MDVSTSGSALQTGAIIVKIGLVVVKIFDVQVG